MTESARDEQESTDRLVHSVERLVDQAADLTQRSRYNRRLAYLALAGFVLDLLLTAAVAYLVGQVVTNSHQLGEVQARVSDRVLCPIFGLLLSAESRSLSAPGLSDQERADRRGWYTVIHSGAEALGCR